MNVQEKVAQITAAIDELTNQAKSLITEAAVEWLNSEEAEKAGVDKIVFGGSTPSFNDGEPCVFNMDEVWATSADSDMISNPNYDYLEDSDEYKIIEGSTAPAGLKAIIQMVNSLDRVGIIERTFDTYGFIAIVHKNGTLEEKEFYCDY